jgi:carboxyl-terminal processing protease
VNSDDERRPEGEEAPQGAEPVSDTAGSSGPGTEPSEASSGPSSSAGSGASGPDVSGTGSGASGDAPVWAPEPQPDEQPGSTPPAQPGQQPSGWYPPSPWQASGQQPGGWPQAGWQQPQPGQQGWPQAGWPPPQPGWQPPSFWPPTPTTTPATLEALASDHQPARRRRVGLAQIVTVVAVALIAFSSGMVVDRQVAPQPAPSSQPLQDFSVYEQALQDIKNNYVGRADVTDQQLLYGSIRGMVDALGDTNHTRFLTPAEYAQLTSQLSGQVAGIGVLLSLNNGTPVVDRVIADSPADKAGIRAGDSIVAVDGKSTSGETFDDLAAQIRGKPGTNVTLTVIHAGSTASVDITITRAQIQAPLVDWGMVPGTTVADIALYEFSDGASKQVAQALAGAKKAGATAIVLDLRGNPGGLADEARSVASEFLSSGVVYQEEDASGKRTSVTVDKSMTATTLPMVVLVDHDTASAAEIVAGAIQDNNRGQVIGLTTVGTGTVLQPFILSDGSVILLGVEDWLTPNGHRIFGVGITPNETVALPTGGQPLDPIDLDKMTASDVQASNDAQLLAGVKALGQ